MFKILGADGKEYGPVAAAQLRQWIHEGRAGGLTQVQAEGEPGWTPLQKRAEFADIFTRPVLSSGGGRIPLPPVVQTIAFGGFLVAGVGLLWQIASVITMLRYAGNSSFHPGWPYYLGWGVGLFSLPIRIISGVGLLRGREWARRLAVSFAAIMTLYGAWALVQTVVMFTRMADASFILRSPMFLLSHLWSLAVLTFNITTVVFLTRKDVRAAFAQKSSGAA